METKDHGIIKEGLRERTISDLVRSIICAFAGFCIISMMTFFLVKGIAANQEFGEFLAFAGIVASMLPFFVSGYFYYEYLQDRKDQKILQEEIRK